MDAKGFRKSSGVAWVFVVVENFGRRVFYGVLFF